MAEQRERLVVELEARVDAFNRDLTLAQRRQASALNGINSRLNMYERTSMGARSSTLALAGSLGGLAASLGAAAAATQFLTQSIETSRAFEAAISDLSAITGATGEDLEFLAAASREFGASTTLSATQAAEAFKLIASAQPALLGNADALARVTREAITLSEATGEDLASSARTLGNSLNQFNESADQSTRFINVLAEGSRLGAASVAEVAESLRNGGLAAAESGISFEETNAILQTFSTVGLRGSEAGTALRTVLVALERTGNRELTPSIVGLNAALDNLADMNLSTTEAVKVFGQEHFQAANILVRNRSEIAQLTQSLTGTNAAYEQASTRVDNLSGDVTALGSAYEGLQIQVGDILTETLNLRDGTQSLTEGIQEFISAGGGIEDVRDLFQAISDVVVDGIDFITLYAEQWEGVFNSVGDGLTSLTSEFQTELNLIGSFLSEVFDFYQRTFLAIPSTLQAVFESSLSAIRLAITEAGLLIIGLAESLQSLPLVGETIQESIGDTIANVRQLLEETAAADRAAISGAFERAEATREAAFMELEARREARQEEREQREEEEEADLERQQEIQDRLTEIVQGGEEQRQEARQNTTRVSQQGDAAEQDSAESKNSDILSDTLRTLQQQTSAASSSSETVFRINQAAGAAQTLISTPAAIMKAYEQLGPIGGSIAAVGIAAAGVEALNNIRAVTLGGGGGGGAVSAGPDVASATDANNEAVTVSTLDVSSTTTSSAGSTTGGQTFRATNTDELGDALVNYINRAIRTGQVELNT